MKRGFFTSVAVVTAFLAGMSVYVACGTSDNGSNATIADLQAEIRLIKNELESLKSQIASLGNGGGTNSCGEFKVDGLYFDRAGQIISKPSQSLSEYYEYPNQSATYIYYYDDSGRLLRMIATGSVSNTTNEYQYFGKTVVCTSTIRYDDPNMPNVSSTLTTEYY